MTTPINKVLLYQEITTDLQNVSQYLKSNNYHAIITPIVHPIFIREFEKEFIRTKHLEISRSDLILSATDWTSRIIPKLSDFIDCDSNCIKIRKLSEKTLIQELSFAEHLVQGCGGMMLKISSQNNINLARIASLNLRGTLIAEVPMVDPKGLAKGQYRNDINSIDDEEDTWHWWNKFRMNADFHMRIKLALELSADIPGKEDIFRWLGEPVEILIIPSNIFLTNSNNFPVLSRAHQELVASFIQHNVHFAIKANEYDPFLHCYADYMKHLIMKHYQNDPMRGLEDVLEIPLQPLYDNLDSYTYEIFERDPVKYKLYQEAIERALMDRVPEKNISTVETIIMVLGAGRGPLVRAALNAAHNTKRKVKIFVIEKNPNAIITLQALINEMWSDQNVTLFKCDMRDFRPPSKADILVSELLGSFGDNELSPECLDGAQKHLKSDGISIPSQSMSYINPTMSSKIYNNVRISDRGLNPRDRNFSYATQAESTYVIYVKNGYQIAEPQPVFEFNHPNLMKPIDNSRFKTLEFKTKIDCVLTGFTGYFDCILYKDIKLSTHPLNHTPGMVSWFTLFFPIAEPMFVKAGEIIKLNIWRCIGSSKVWYEWSTSEPIITHIHNHNGRSCSISM